MSEKKDSSRSPRETNGPVVKTGPTAGQNRSRNKDGSWHAKRSDAGKPKKSGCFITSAVCHYKGLPDDCHELETLRRFRDQYLLTSKAGQALVAEYYEVAPDIADRLTSHAELEHVWQVVCECVRAVEERRFGEAERAYTAMIRRLRERDLVK